MNLVPATDRFLGATAMRFPAAASLVIALVLVGCQESDEGIEYDVRDPVVFATHVKSRTVVYLLRIKENPAVGPAKSEALVEMLEPYQVCPVGDHEAIYADLLAKCKALSEMYKDGGSGRSKGKTDLMNEIDLLAKQLPGELIENYDR